MSFEITTGFVQQFALNIELLLQQRGSRLRNCVSEQAFVGEAGSTVDQIGKTEAVECTTRHADTPLVNSPHDRRWAYPKDFDWGDLIDNIDRLRMITDPTSAYAINAAYALGRSMDREIIRGFFDDARTGKNGGVIVPFDTAKQQVAANDTGLTVEKLRAAKKILKRNQVDTRHDPLYIAVTAEQLDDLLGSEKTTSSDYNTIKTLVQGEIDTFMGFKFEHTELLTDDGGGNREIPCWAKSGVTCGIWNDITTTIDRLPTKRNSTQVYTTATFGSTRNEEGKVVKILCKEG